MKRLFAIPKFIYFKNKIPVYWGNRYWHDLSQRITSSDSLFRLHPRWINYKKLPNGETAKLLSDDHPESNYRQKYHQEIIDEVVSGLVAVPSDERVCFFTSGGTASGKTSAVDEIVGKSMSIKVDGGIRIDYDRLKKVLPEYDYMIANNIKEAARYTQAESAKLGAKIFKKSYKTGCQIIFEQTLENSRMPMEYFRDLKKRNYEIVIVATHVPEVIGQQRATDRFKKSGRFVPVEAIKKIYATVPTTLFELRDKVDKVFLFDNSGSQLELMFTRDLKKGSNIINRNLYENYLNNVGSHLDLGL